jgi:ribosomal-protein-alanine N-acetyltransferase
VAFPILDTKRLRLSALEANDTKAVYALFSDPLVVEYYDLDVFTDESEAINLISFFKQRFESGEGIRWAIRLKDTGQFIGTFGFNTSSTKMKSAVIGYELQRQYWGLGFAAEAVHRIVRAAFNGELPCGAINRIQADTVPGNNMSESVLQSIGFCEEGVRRQSGYWKGQFHDLKCFGSLRSQYMDERQNT